MPSPLLFIGMASYAEARGKIFRKKDLKEKGFCEIILDGMYVYRKMTDSKRRTRKS